MDYPGESGGELDPSFALKSLLLSYILIREVKK